MIKMSSRGEIESVKNTFEMRYILRHYYRQFKITLLINLSKNTDLIYTSNTL